MNFDEWCDSVESEFNIEMGESGADREMDYDPERILEKRYEDYLKSNQLLSLHGLTTEKLFGINKKNISMKKVLKLQIVKDANAISPRNGGNASTIAIASNKYLQGDASLTSHKHLDSSIEDYGGGDKRNAVYLPIWAYKHVMHKIFLKTSPFQDSDLPQGHNCNDTFFCGYIILKRNKFLRSNGYGNITKKRLVEAYEILTNELKEYETYINGDIFGYQILDILNDEEVASVYNIYGREHAEELGKDHLDEEIAKNERINNTGQLELF